jgi:hypothetical protein
MIALAGFFKNKQSFFLLNQLNRNMSHLLKAQTMITQQKLMKMNNPIWIERSLKVMIYWISNQIN